jgi:hypothetical protein
MLGENLANFILKSTFDFTNKVNEIKNYSL